MKKQFKQTYLSPETESLLVQSESVVLSGGSPYGNQGAPGQVFSNGGVFLFDDED